jgi:hypothetical protein
MERFFSQQSIERYRKLLDITLVKRGGQSRRKLKSGRLI